MAVIYRWARWLFGLGLVVIGLPGIPGDIDGWGQWISALHGMSWFSADLLRWSLFSIGVGLLAWVNYPAIKSRFSGTAFKWGPAIAELKIRSVEGVGNAVGRYMRFEGNGGTCTWYLEIINESHNSDAQDVEIKVESLDQIVDILNPHNRTGAFMQVGIALTFERGGQARTIRRQDSEWVRFLSFDRHPPRRWIQIGEYVQGPLDLHGKIASVYTPHRIELTVRAANAKPVTAIFSVKAESEMLEVRML